MEEFYTTRQVAKMLGVKTITIRRWIGKGFLPAVNLGREYRIVKKELEKFLNQRRVKK